MMFVMPLDVLNDVCISIGCLECCLYRHWMLRMMFVLPLDA